MLKLLPVFLLLTVFTFTVSSKTIVIPKPVAVHAPKLKADSSKVVPRKFDTAAIRSYLKDREFNYSEVNKPLTWWDRFWDYIWHTINNWLNRKKPASDTQANPVIKYLFIGIAISLIIFIVIKIIGIDNIFNRKAKKATIDYTESPETIHGVLFDEEIEKALAVNNYRLAVRLLYLRCLQQLNDANLINWQIEKTNAAYINELTNAEQKKYFGLLTRQFEYVWYGGFPVDKRLFRDIDNLFVDFKKILP